MGSHRGSSGAGRGRVVEVAAAAAVVAEAAGDTVVAEVAVVEATRPARCCSAEGRSATELIGGSRGAHLGLA
jgi:hypothetical protein